MFPDDWVSFIWGGASVALLWFLSSFVKAAGKDAWGWTKNKFNPKPPEPIEVSPRFSPDLYPLGSCAWVPETDVPDKELKEWGFYPHPKTSGKCFRKTNHSGVLVREFLMVSPEALKENT